MALLMGEPSAKPVALPGVHAPPALASACALSSHQNIVVSILLLSVLYFLSLD